MVGHSGYILVAYREGCIESVQRIVDNCGMHSLNTEEEILHVVTQARSTVSTESNRKDVQSFVLAKQFERFRFPIRRAENVESENRPPEMHSKKVDMPTKSLRVKSRRHLVYHW
jgi:hypothetical protein